MSDQKLLRDIETTQINLVAFVAISNLLSIVGSIAKYKLSIELVDAQPLECLERSKSDWLLADFEL